MRNSNHSMLALSLLGLSLTTGCAYDESLYNKHIDIQGLVRIPAEASQVEVFNSENESWIVDDPRAFGPVYLGVYPDVVDDLYEYSHPEIGPVINTAETGDAYPLGGNSIGRFDFGCYEQITCQVVTGRYQDYDDVLQFFRDELRDPIKNQSEEEVLSGVEYQERCFELEYLTDDLEVDFHEGGIQHFTLSSDEQYWEADVEILHTEYWEGMKVWGWVDMPAGEFSFSTCDSSNGNQIYYYNEQYLVGTNFLDLLNFPNKYIDEGDWIANDGVVVTPDSDFVIELGYNYVD